MRVIFHTIGLCLVGLAFWLMVPALLETTLHTHDWEVFAFTALLSLFIGGMLVFTNRGGNRSMSTRQIYLLTISLWIVIPVVSALPFYFTTTSYHLSFTDAVFESVSGMTTTGSTVYSHLDAAPKGILLWRSLVQWLGGMGIIVLVMIIFPHLRVGGMQMFQSESSDRSGKVLPRVHEIAAVTTISYISLSVLCALMYRIGGMTGWDAINHAMTTLSTGGYSTHDASFGYFDKSPFLEWMGSLFMMLGATPMLLYISFFTNRTANRPLLYQTKVFWLEVIVIVLAVAAYITHTMPHMDFSVALREAAFNIVSVATTTGYASTDYGLWGAFPVMIFYFLTITGGCTGSTSGGIKTFRFIVMAKSLIYQMKKLILPHGVFSVHMGETVITEEIMQSVGVLFLMYVFFFTIITIMLSFSGMDMIASMSATATAMAGVGPGLGPIIGPVGNFIPLTDFAKWSLVLAMIAGRLEVMAIFLMFSKEFWRD